MAYPYGDEVPAPIERPSWMSDVTVEVDVHSVETFAQAIRGELQQNVAPNAAAILGRLAGEGSYNPAYDGYAGPPSYVPGSNRTFGVDPRLPWASIAGLRQMECEQKAARFLDDLRLGLQAVADAASHIAAEYGSADERNSLDVQNVNNLFTERGELPNDDPRTGGTARAI